MPTADQIALVVHTLGFSKRQLAELFGVSRQAIYDWLKGRSISGENASKLSKIAGLVMEVTPDTRRPLHHQFTTQPLTDREPSILDLLRADPWDMDRIFAQLHRARELTSQLLAGQDSGRDRITQEQGDGNFVDNLLSLGEE
jgi:transcriptional regulator with XRE-family HTH domain